MSFSYQFDFPSLKDFIRFLLIRVVMQDAVPEHFPFAVVPDQWFFFFFRYSVLPSF